MSMLSADVGEFVMLILGAGAIAVIIAGIVLWRRDRRWVSWTCAGAVVDLVLVRALFHWHEGESFLLLFPMAWAASVACFTALRWRGVGFSAVVSWAGGAAGGVMPILLLLLLAVLRNSERPVWERGYWPLLLLPATLVSIALVVAFAHLVRLYRAGGRPRAESGGAETPVRDQDRRMVLNMLREGKVSGQQAADLLAALGPDAGGADGLPLTRAVLAAVGGAILIVIGFMLPWTAVHVRRAFGATIQSYQAGYNVGFLGWLVLSVGVLPALLVCIPALERHVRQGLLRLVIASIGAAFAVVLLVRSPHGLGLWIVAAGFAVHLLSSVRQARLA